MRLIFILAVYAAFYARRPISQSQIYKLARSERIQACALYSKRRGALDRRRVQPQLRFITRVYQMFGVARLVIDYDRRAVGITYQQVDNALNEHALARISVAVKFARASVVIKYRSFATNAAPRVSSRIACAARKTCSPLISSKLSQRSLTVFKSGLSKSISSMARWNAVPRSRAVSRRRRVCPTARDRRR